MMVELCPACRSPRSRKAFALSDSAFRRCKNCKSLYDAEPATQDQMREMYGDKSYFVKEDDAGGAGRTLCGYTDDYVANRENVEEKFAHFLGHVERYARPGRLLDVGCGPGFLLSVARGRGWETLGVDLNPWAVDFARGELGLDVVHGELAELDENSESFDAITMTDLIEHLPAPDEFLEASARLIKPDGCIALLTPDAGSVPSRVLGRRWPEVRRLGEHAVLYSVEGLSELLRRHGFIAGGWHSVGKKASLRTLAADVSPVAPRAANSARRALERIRFGDVELDFDPRTKYCLYGRKAPTRGRTNLPARVPKNPETQASVEGAIVEELQNLAEAELYCDWLYSRFSRLITGSVAEVGAGIGTFSVRMLESGIDSLTAIEPEPQCAAVLESRFAEDPRVSVVRDTLPAAPSLQPGSFDAVVCQNVLEHISDDAASLASMATALRRDGHLALIVPALPKLFGPLDEAYGHRRRYELDLLKALVMEAGLKVVSIDYMNAPGIAAWWMKNRRPGARVGTQALNAYEHVVRMARPVEDRARVPVGLSLVCIAKREADREH